MVDYNTLLKATGRFKKQAGLNPNEDQKEIAQMRAIVQRSIDTENLVLLR